MLPSFSVQWYLLPTLQATCLYLLHKRPNLLDYDNTATCIVYYIIIKRDVARVSKENHTTKFHHIFRTRYPWPWLGSLSDNSAICIYIKYGIMFRPVCQVAAPGAKSAVSDCISLGGSWEVGAHHMPRWFSSTLLLLRLLSSWRSRYIKATCTVISVSTGIGRDTWLRLHPESFHTDINLLSAIITP